MTDLSEFDSPIVDNAIVKSQEVGQAVETVAKNAVLLDSTQVSLIITSISEAGQLRDDQANKVVYDADFSIAGMIGEQINAVIALRKSVFAGGEIKHGVSVRDAQSVISTTNSMITSLTKHHESVQGMERGRLVERAVVESLKEVKPELMDRFFELLAEKLEQL